MSVPRINALLDGISTIDELEKAWDKALQEAPGSLMAELDPEVQRKYREIVNKRLREQFQKEKL